MIIKFLAILLIFIVTLRLFYYSANFKTSSRFIIVLIVVTILILIYFISMDRLGDYICEPLNSIITCT